MITANALLYESTIRSKCYNKMMILLSPRLNVVLQICKVHPLWYVTGTGHMATLEWKKSPSVELKASFPTKLSNSVHFWRIMV